MMPDDLYECEQCGMPIRKRHTCLYCEGVPHPTDLLAREGEPFGPPYFGVNEPHPDESVRTIVYRSRQQEPQP